MDTENKLAKLLIQEEPRRSGRATYQQFKGLQADNKTIGSIREGGTRVQFHGAPAHWRIM